MKKSTFMLITLLSIFIMILIPIGALTIGIPGSTTQLSSLSPMLRKVMPSVVSVLAEGKNIVTVPLIPEQFQQFFDKNFSFYHESSPFQHSLMFSKYSFNRHKNDLNLLNINHKFRSLGSGVVIDSNRGYVVTNNHVIDHAINIHVQLNDSRLYEAKIIAKDPQSDIALIQLKNAKNLTAIAMLHSDNIHIGDHTVAIGNSYGLGETVTSGIISGLGRSGLNIQNYEDFIQTDAAINHGNSGGALVNLEGELIGINTAILAPNSGNIGIGFAIPISMVKNLTAQMEKYGEVNHGELGILGSELNYELAKAININIQSGIFINQVLINSSASKAGIKAGDIILSINGRTPISFSSLRAEVSSMSIGSQIKLGLLRDGEYLQINFKLQRNFLNKFKFKYYI